MQCAYWSCEMGNGMVATPYSGWFGLPSTACNIIFCLPHFSSQAFAVAVPTDETVRRVIAPFTLLVFVTHNLLNVRKPSIRQILERLFDFVVLQFDTPLECKKAGTFDFSKVPASPI